MLAPMAGYTDKPFRAICRTFGASLTFSELISVNAICYDNPKTTLLYERHETDSPFCIQLFGSDPVMFVEAARRVEDRCECININAGCPAKKVIKAKAGSYLLKEKTRLLAIVDALKKNIKKPLSVKMRMGFDSQSINTIDFYRELQARGVDFIVIHPRLRDQFFSGKLNYEHIARVREKLTIDVVVSGGIDSPDTLKHIKQLTGCDLFMIGQAAIGAPYIFEDLIAGFKIKRNADVICNIMNNHFSAMIEFYGKKKALLAFRKFFCVYSRNFVGARHLRRSASTCEDTHEMFSIIEQLRTMPVQNRG